MSLNARLALITMPAFANGRVAVFTRKPSGWTRTGTLAPMQGDTFQGSVSLGRELALVGAGSSTYVYRRTGHKLRFLQRLPGNVDALAVADDVAFVGGSGAVSVYESGKHGKLRLVQSLTSGEGIPDIGFGTSLAISRGTLAVAAPGAADGRGAVYVFERRGARWVKRQKLQAIDGQADAVFARRVAVDDGLIAVSAGVRTGGDGGRHLF
jgi:hypothetical protein